MNVLVRPLMHDDPAQAKKAEEAFLKYAKSEGVFQGAKPLLTFDRKLARVDGVQLLQPARYPRNTQPDQRDVSRLHIGTATDAICWPAMATVPGRDLPARPAPPLRLTGIVLPVRMARALAGLLLAGALGLPWLATWQGALRDESPAGAAARPREVQLRPELVELPGGTFLMGSPPVEADRSDDEKQHPAEVAPFAICRTEVTLGQWEAVMGTRPNNCEYGCNDEHPVQRVSWEDAIRYLNELTDRENELRPASEKLARCYDEATWAWERNCTGYRLPTEAEWEYAARATTTTTFSFGNDPKDLCVYCNGAPTECDDGYARFAPVASFKPNGWGLFDMYGNVWEWIWDWYGPYPERSAVGYAGPAVGEGRVLRGGSSGNLPKWLRSSQRGREVHVPGGSAWQVGIRCARSSTPHL